MARKYENSVLYVLFKRKILLNTKHKAEEYRKDESIAFQLGKMMLCRSQSDERNRGIRNFIISRAKISGESLSINLWSEFLTWVHILRIVKYKFDFIMQTCELFSAFSPRNWNPFSMTTQTEYFRRFLKAKLCLHYIHSSSGY